MSKKAIQKTIIINDPEMWGLKYGGKNRQWYYKIRSDFFNNPLVFDLENHTKILLLDIFLHSLRVDKGSLSYCLGYAKGLLRVSLDTVKDSLRELESNNIISLQTKVRRQYIEENRIEENRREENKKSKQVFDLESAYKNYPSTQGKKVGMEKLKKLINTEQQYQELLTGISNYKKHLEIEDWKKPQNFSTFVNQETWKDYLIEIKTDEQKFEDALNGRV